MKLEPQPAHGPPTCERRVLLLPPTSRDASALRKVFDSYDIECLIFQSMSDLCRAIAQGAATVIVSEEALAANPEELFECLRVQPVWSDLPIIVLSRSGSESPKLTGLLEKAGNVSVVERPVRISTLVSVVRAAIRGRTRQYDVREHLKQIQSVESARTALLESERAARTEAERAGRMKDEFLATLSHEIRTPLNAILGWTHLLSRKHLPGDEVEKGVAVIKRNAEAQSQIVADLLDMNRITNGKVRLDVRHFDLAPVVQAALDTVALAAEAKGVRLQAILDPSAGLVSGDPERLQQVFWNLFSNAVKFTLKGGRVQVVLERVESHIEVRIADSGEGISPEFLPHVFDRFRQADGSTTRRHGGLGLGLAIVKQLVELHGGSVSASSQGTGRGSTFVVALPLAAASPKTTLSQQPPLAAQGPRTPAAPCTDDIGGVRVLVVDDEADARDLVKRLLESCGASVRTASSANEALSLLQQERPDVLVSDIGMPGEDGYTLMRHLRTLSAKLGGQTAAIALTAYARAEDRVHAIRAGFQYHLSKPVDPTELIAAVASAAHKYSK